MGTGWLIKAEYPHPNREAKKEHIRECSAWPFVIWVERAEYKEGGEVRIIEKRGQNADHPVFLTFPKSYYLKCLFWEKG